MSDHISPIKLPYLVRTKPETSVSWHKSNWAWQRLMQHFWWSHSTQIGCKSLCRCYSNRAQASKRPCWATSHWKAQCEHVSSPRFIGSELKCPTAQRLVCPGSCCLYCMCPDWSYSSALWCWDKVLTEVHTDTDQTTVCPVYIYLNRVCIETFKHF